MLQRLCLAALIAAAGLPGVAAVAADSTRAGDVTIYHSAFPSDALTPEVASAAGLKRSPHFGVLNVSVREDRAGAVPAPVKALVDADLFEGERRLGPVPMREVEVMGGTSYLGQFPIRDGQELEFEIRVRPAGAAAPTTVHLRQEFFRE